MAADDTAAAGMLALTDTLTSRVCHDMAGLVATLSGTLEMVLEDGDTGGEAASLAVEAASALTARIKLLRAAWGGGDFDDSTLEGLAAGLPGRNRLTLDLSAIDAADDLPAGGKRLALCLLLAACDGMPAGGTMTGATGASWFSLTLCGRNAGWHRGLAAGNGQVDGAWWSPRHMAVPMAALTASCLGWTLTVSGERLHAAHQGPSR